MRTSAIITTGALALVLTGALALVLAAAARNAHARLSGAQQALQGSWEVSLEETFKPQAEQELAGQSDESLRTLLTNRGVNAARMNRKQMEEEYTRAVARTGRMAGQMPRMVITFSGNSMTGEEIALNGARTTQSSGPFTADGAAIMWDGTAYPYTLKGNTLTMDVNGTRMIFYKTKQP